jgi:N6-adenosine-specific RNA methylase IME4
MSGLVKYEAAKAALAEACRVDEVKGIRDKALAMQTYARQAKDGDMIAWATDIRLRAERKAGQMLREMDEKRERRRSEEPGNTALPALSDLGVTKMQSSRWQKLGALDDEQFEERAAVAKRQAVASVEATAAERTAEKKERRAEREVELAAKQTALPDKRYGVILADPEWKFEPYSRETGMDRAADNHYPTSELEAIKQRDVASIAAEDCVLFLWATAPMMPQALEVMQAWGFTYKTHAAWRKDRIGTGYWFRGQHELLLVGVKGDVPAPAAGTQWSSVIEAPVREHSAKPDEALRMIESYFPTLPKIELNARRARFGWDSWGLEAPIAEKAA